MPGKTSAYKKHMEKIELIKKIENINKPNVYAPIAQKRLSKLLETKYQKNNFNNIFMTKQMKLILPSIAVLVMFLTIGLGVIPGINQAKKVQAKEIIDGSKVAISQISEETRAKLESMIKDDLSNSLQEAYEAKDLVYVGEQDLTTIDIKDSNLKIHFLDSEVGIVGGNGTATVSIVSTDTNNELENSLSKDNKVVINVGTFIGNDLASMKKIRILKYTNEKGERVVLGLNENDLPVMKVVSMPNKK